MTLNDGICARPFSMIAATADRDRRLSRPSREGTVRSGSPCRFSP
jgi:hypothetical protein